LTSYLERPKRDLGFNEPLPQNTPRWRCRESKRVGVEDDRRRKDKQTHTYVPVGQYI